MAIDFWNDEEEFTGEYLQDGGGDFPIIPHETRVMALIDKAELAAKENYKDGKRLQNCISLRFSIEDGEFKGQKIFKKFFIESENEEQARKDFSMLMNIDANAGGKIKKLKRIPDEEELQLYLINKSMVIVVGAFFDKDKKKEQNYLMGVSSGNKAPAKAATPKTPTAAPKTPANQVNELDEDDIPFN